jgi:penicillin amidase
MKIKTTPKMYKICNKNILLSRSDMGVMKITTDSFSDFNMSMGFVHAHDRMMQMMLVRTIAQGRLSECLKSDDETLDVDIFMREMGLYGEAQKEVENLSSEAKSFLKSYCDGVNDYQKRFSRPLEFTLVGFKPEPWSAADTLVMVKIMSYIGLAQTQQGIEKFIIQAVKNNTNIDKLKKLFSPHLDEMSEEIVTLIKKAKLYQCEIPDSVKFIGALPKMKASNNWMLGPSKSKTGSVIQCNDPHLECNRLPAVWYEYTATVGDQKVCGVNMPGVPGLIMGRTDKFGLGFTYGFMDMIDYFLEEVKDGRFQESGEYRDFNGRDEIIKRKGKKDYLLKVYENDRGILENDPTTSLEDGIYLTRAWSGHKNGAAGSVEVLARLLKAKNAKEAGALVKDITISCNWIVGDTSGDILFQQSGLLPRRSHSGLYPVEGWDLSKNWKGLHSSDDLSKELNPESGFLATANNDLNQLGKPLSINMPMGPYRVDRISQLIKEKHQLDTEDMKLIQKDLYSLQAKEYFKIIAPLIPDSHAGRILKAWDFMYDRTSVGATLFEEFYNDLLEEVFGGSMFGRDVWKEVIKETGIVVDFYHLFDKILLGNDHQRWFVDKTEVFQKVLEKTLSRFSANQILPWGQRRPTLIKNIFFDGALPSFLGFDKGPYNIEGNRATIVQGAVYKAHGRETTFCPSYRFISDLGSLKAETALAGGPSDRRFSKWYSNDLDNWYNFKYKTLEL